MAVEKEGRLWELMHSWWMIWAFIPTLAWVSFVWIGAKARKRQWLVWAAAYFVVLFLGVWVPTAILSSKDDAASTFIGLLIIFGTVAGIVHVFLVRSEYLLRIEALQPIRLEAQRAEVASIREDYGDLQAETRARALFEQCNGLVMQIEGELTLEARARPSAIRTLYADALAKRAEGERLLDDAKVPHEFHAAEGPLQQALQGLQQVRQALSTPDQD